MSTPYDYETFDTEFVAAGVLHVMMNRPRKLNAMCAPPRRARSARALACVADASDIPSRGLVTWRDSSSEGERAGHCHSWCQQLPVPVAAGTCGTRGTASAGTK